ncbi:MAG: hypothetical protein ACK5QT_00010 [Oligoflexia bacterium]
MIVKQIQQNGFHMFEHNHTDEPCDECKAKIPPKSALTELLGFYWDYLEPWHCMAIVAEARRCAFEDREQEEWAKGKLKLKGGPFDGSKARAEMCLFASRGPVELPESQGRVALYRFSKNEVLFHYVRTERCGNKRYQDAQRNLQGVANER